MVNRLEQLAMAIFPCAFSPTRLVSWSDQGYPPTEPIRGLPEEAEDGDPGVKTTEARARHRRIETDGASRSSARSGYLTAGWLIQPMMHGWVDGNSMQPAFTEVAWEMERLSFIFLFAPGPFLPVHVDAEADSLDHLVNLASQHFDPFFPEKPPVEYLRGSAKPCIE